MQADSDRSQQIHVKKFVDFFTWYWVVSNAIAVLLGIFLAEGGVQIFCIVIPIVMVAVLTSSILRFELSSIATLRVGRKFSYIMGVLALTALLMSGLSGSTEQAQSYVVMTLTFGIVALSGVLIEASIAHLEDTTGGGIC